MKTYQISWTQHGGSSNYLQQTYGEEGQVVDRVGTGSFSTDNESIARKVYDSELEYVKKNGIPRLDSLPWSAGLTDSDSAWKDIWTLNLDEIEIDADGDVVNLSDIQSSDYYYFGK